MAVLFYCIAIVLFIPVFGRLLWFWASEGGAYDDPSLKVSSILLALVFASLWPLSVPVLIIIGIMHFVLTRRGKSAEKFFSSIGAFISKVITGA